MRKIALIALTSLPIFAGFFPQTTHTSITQANQSTVSLAQPFPVAGMSGVVVHNYGNEIEAITSRIIQKGTQATLVADDIIKHDSLPSINTEVSAGDKVIGGYLYNNILLLAPDAKSYADITASTDKNWIHPDLYALFLENIGENVPTKSNLKRFAKAYQVGLVYIVSQNSAKLLDPISGQIISQKSANGTVSEPKSPFYMRFTEIDGGLFTSDNTKSYYQIMERF